MVSLKAILLVMWVFPSGVTSDHVEYETMKACTNAMAALVGAAQAKGHEANLVVLCTSAQEFPG